MDKKITYNNSSLKLTIEREYTIELIPVTIYKKRPCVSCGKDAERYQKSFPKASRGVSKIAHAI